MADRLDPSPGGGARGWDGHIEAEALSHLDSLFSTALRLTRDRARAEDLVQDTFLKAVRFAGQFERGTNLRAWLFTILHNTFRNELRGAGRDPVEIDSEVVEGASTSRTSRDDPESLLMRASLGPDLEAALAGLPEGFRQAVWLRDVEEFSYAEIAGMLSIPVGTVMSRIARGRRALYQRLTAGRERQTGTRRGREESQ
jgi:RNA polymerase sigma-70 factor (ECF subfamily)